MDATKAHMQTTKKMSTHTKFITNQKSQNTHKKVLGILTVFGMRKSRRPNFSFKSKGLHGFQIVKCCQVSM